MYLILFTFDKILQYWQIFVPIHHVVDKNLAIEKSYRPNLKRIQVKTTQKLCLLSMSQLEFGSEWQPCRVDVTPCQLPNIASSLMM